MDITSPILPGLEDYELFANEKDPSSPKLLRSPDGRVITRWTFTDEERQMIARGEDLFLTTMTYNQKFQPIRLNVRWPQPGFSTEEIKRDMQLDDQAELIALSSEYVRLATAANEAQLALKRKQQEVFTPPEPSKIALVH